MCVRTHRIMKSLISFAIALSSHAHFTPHQKSTHFLLFLAAFLLYFLFLKVALITLVISCVSVYKYLARCIKLLVFYLFLFAKFHSNIVLQRSFITSLLWNWYPGYQSVAYKEMKRVTKNMKHMKIINCTQREEWDKLCQYVHENRLIEDSLVLFG